MKTFLLTFVICLFNLNLTEIVGKYQIESERSGDSLELKKDGTYKYEPRGDSCWTWSDITGTWEFENGILTLNHYYSYQEDSTKYIENTKPKSDGTVTFEVKDNFGNPITDFEVNYWSKNKQTRKTNDNGIVKFDECSQMRNDNETVSVSIKYLTNENETSVSSQVFKKSNYIILTINSEPKTINKKEKYRFEFNDEKLKSIEFPYVDETSTYKKL